jgi:hypothetical protein
MSTITYINNIKKVYVTFESNILKKQVKEIIKTIYSETMNIIETIVFDNLCESNEYTTKLLIHSDIWKKLMDENRYIQILDMFYNHNYDLTKNINCITTIPSNIFIKQITETYKDKKSIIKQFMIDFPRQSIIINNKNILTVNEVIEIIKIIKIENKMSILMLILILSCQSSFYVSFNILFEKQLEMNKNMDTNVCVVDSKNREKNKIIFKMKKNMFICKLKSKYDIINTESGQILSNIESEIIYDINYDECVIIHNKLFTT